MAKCDMAKWQTLSEKSPVFLISATPPLSISHTHTLSLALVCQRECPCVPGLIPETMHMNQKSEAVRNLVWFLARVDTGEPGPESHYLRSPDKALSLSALMCSRGCWLWGLCQASVPLTTVSSSPVRVVSYSSRSTLCLFTQTITFCFFPPRSPHLFCSFYLSMWMSGLLLSIWICSTCMPGALRSH